MIENYAFIESLKGLPFVEGIYLFGSRARGDNSPRADIDLAISCPKANDSEWNRILEIVENADTLLEIDVLRFEETSGRMRENILRDKKVLYQKRAKALSKLSKALDRLEESLRESPAEHPIVMDGTIQRFEFVTELCWKTLKVFLEAEGVEANFPRQVLQQAYKDSWIKDETLWLNVLNDRNMAAHTYNQDLAQKIYANIKAYYPEFRRLLSLLQSRL